jgi:hypothetical protein
MDPGYHCEQGVSVVPFFNNQYKVSKLGISGDLSYAAKVVLLKYLLMCPLEMPGGGTDWIPYWEFKDSGQSDGAGLSDYVAQTQASIVNPYVMKKTTSQVVIIS